MPSVGAAATDDIALDVCRDRGSRTYAVDLSQNCCDAREKNLRIMIMMKMMVISNDDEADVTHHQTATVC